MAGENNCSSGKPSSQHLQPSDGREPALTTVPALGGTATHTSTQDGPRGQQRQKFVEGLKYAAAGGVAGAFAKTCTAPLARLTILYQVQGFSFAAGDAAAAARPPPNLRHAFLQVIQREGVAALWKGNLVTILHRLPYSSINFYTYEHTNKFLVKHLPPNTDFQRTLAAGATSGLMACTAAYPLDLVRTRLAAQTQGHYYTGILPSLRRIMVDEGMVGLYRGLGATLLQVVPSLALNFSLYDSIRNSCMAVYSRASRQPVPAAAVADIGKQHSELQAPSSNSSGSASHARASAGSAGSLLSTREPPDSLAHSLAVAASVDQGISHSQMLIWHLEDDAVGSGSWQRATAAAVAAEDAYTTRRASGANASISSSHSSTTGSSSASCPSSRGSASPNAVIGVPAGISLASGCISGFITATATFPLDVIRRRMQVYGQTHHGQPVSYSEIIRQIMKQQGGLRGFYVGILPEYCKVVPGVAIAFCTYEQMKKWLQAD